MKHIAGALGALALVIGGMQPALAADMDYDKALGLVVSGQVESWSGYMFYGNETGDFSSDDGSTQMVSGLSGRLSLPLSDNLSVQMDGAIEYASLFESAKDDLFTDSHQFGTHLSWRDPSSLLFGAFAAFGSGTHDDDTVAADFFAIAGEAQFYSNDMTFYVQGGYLDGRNNDDYLRDAYFGRGVARWFVSPDSRLQAEVSYVSGVIDTNRADTDIIEWGGRYDTVIEGLPIVGDSHVFIGYRGASFDKAGPDDGGFTDHTIMVGFTRSFGGGSMKEFDRVGATLDMPNFGRWVGAGEALE